MKRKARGASDAMTASSKPSEQGPSKIKRQRLIEQKVRELKVYKKPPKVSKYRKSLVERGREEIRKPGERGRTALLKIVKFLDTGEEYKVSEMMWCRLFEQEREIEGRDPITFDEAIARVGKDIESIFTDAAAALRAFEPLPDIKLRDRATLEELEALWMKRWIKPPDRPKRDEDDWKRLVGFAGEYLVFRVLKSIVPGFSTDNWTSANRNYAFPDLPALSDKASISDFTYEGDAEGMQVLANLLGLEVDQPKRFFIEVKTSKKVENSFCLSDKQLRLLQTIHEEDDPDEVYVILKVDNARVLRDARITQIIENPWNYVRYKHYLKLYSSAGTTRAVWN